MQQRQLGTSGLTVSALGLGCMGMSEFYGQANKPEALATIHLAIERGTTFFDTADIYGQGHNETFVGAAIKEHRHQIILATKFGIVRNREGEFVGVNGRPDYVRSACEASLKRLEVDVIDLYYQHRVDPDIPIEETVGAMMELVQEGKVRYLGLSEASAQTLRKAHAVHPIAALQTEYSLWTRDSEDEILPTCRELGIGFVSYSPLGRGFLTHQITKPEDLDEEDSRRKNPRFRPENFQHNLHLVEAIEKLAESKHCTCFSQGRFATWAFQKPAPKPCEKHMQSILSLPYKRNTPYGPVIRKMRFSQPVASLALGSCPIVLLDVDSLRIKSRNLKT